MLCYQQEGALLAEVCQQALEGMTEAVWMGDAAGRLTYVNQAFCALTGYAAEECLGRCWDILQVRWAAAAADAF